MSVAADIGGGSDEASSDSIQLIAVATFNGLCRTIAALASNQLIDAPQIADIHESMTAPLDDPDHRDDQVVANVRNTLEEVLATAMMCRKNGLSENLE